MIYSTEDGSGPKRIFVAGLSKVNQLDLIIHNSDSNNIGILYDFGNSTFAKLETYLTAADSAPRWVSTGDINNDSGCVRWRLLWIFWKPHYIFNWF
jgi:hypothetical protein